MKENKKKIIILVIAILVLIILLGIFFFRSQKKVGVTKIYNLDVSSIVSNVEDNFIAKNNNKFGLIKDNGLILVDFNYDAMYMDNNVYANIIFSNGENNHIYDRKGNLLFSVDGHITTYLDVLGKKEYYLVKEKLYNEEGKIVANVEEELQRVLGDYLVYADKVINMLTKESFNIDKYYIAGDYVIFTNYSSGYLYDYKGNELNSYDSVTMDKNHFNLSNELFIDLDGVKHIEKEKYITRINKNYYIDYSSCNEGFILKNNRDERISNTCYFSYKLNKDNIIFLSSKRNTSIYDAVLYKNGNLGSNQTFYDIGKIIGVKHNNVFNYYNVNGKSISVDCRGALTYINEQYYLCNNGDSKYIIDHSYKRVSDYFDELICHDNDSICIVKKDGKYGLMHNNKLITNINYPYIEKINNYYVSNDIFSYQVFVLGTFNTLDLNDTNYVMYTKYETLNTNNIIKEYELDEIRNIIIDNETLFKKFSYVVLHNSKVNGFRREILMMFKVIVDNKNLLDEYYLLNSLKDLIVDKDGDIGVAAGAYANEKLHVTIRLNSENVIYHEIMHFIDFRLKPDDIDKYYTCSNNVITEKEYGNYDESFQNNCQILNIPYSKFILEAGTEYYAAYYLTKEITAYEEGVLIFGALSYMFGEQEIKNLYFNNDSDVRLYMLLKDYLDEGEFNNFLKTCNNLVDNRIVDKGTDVSVILKYLISIYEVKYRRDWSQDNEFKYILNSIRNKYKLDSNIINPTNLEDNSLVNTVIDKINDNDYIYASNYGKYLLIDGKSYVIFGANKNGILYTFVVDYDFKNNVVNDYKVLVL